MEVRLPLISIVIPTYNRAHIIGETLDSVQNQTYQNWECIVVDDLSDDNTDELMEELINNDNRFKYFKRYREPKGAPTCRNIGIEKSKGEFIYFFDSDDIMYPNLLSIFLHQFERDNKLEFCCCEADYFQDDRIVMSTNFVEISHSIESLLLSYGFMAPGYFSKKHTISELGFWDESIKRIQDVDYFSRLIQFEKKGIWIGQTLFKIRMHQKNITSTWNREVCKSLIKVHKKIAKGYGNKRSKELNEILGRRISAFSISGLASGYWGIALQSFPFALSLLPTNLKISRLKMFLILCFKKPFIKNKEDIILYY